MQAFSSGSSAGPSLREASPVTLLVMRHKLFLIKPNDGYQGVNSNIGLHPCTAFYSVTISVSSGYSPVASRGQSPLRAYDHCSREESHPPCSVSRADAGQSHGVGCPYSGWGMLGHEGFTAHTKRHGRSRQKPQGPTRAGRSHGEGRAPRSPCYTK